METKSPVGHNQLAAVRDVREWRRYLHSIPGLAFDVGEAAAFVADKLRSFGCDTVEGGVGRSGVVATIRGKGEQGHPVIGLRADMDGLPIHEQTGADYASKYPGHMHACGHDGHTAMLLGAARHLAANRDFNGIVVLIFQPAEEDGGGAQAMIDDGLIERYKIERIYGMHNMPELPVGEFAIRSGVVMAAVSDFTITVRGRGGHAARPHKAVDPLVAAATLLLNLQSIVSRNIDPLDEVVVSVTTIHGGSTYNVIPEDVILTGTCRTLRSGLDDIVRDRILNICRGTGIATSSDISLEYRNTCIPTFNHPEDTDISVRAARRVSYSGHVNQDIDPKMGAEDFAYMLNVIPGSYIFLGNGDSYPLHHPRYDFNDEALPCGINYWINLVHEVAGSHQGASPARS